MIYAKLLALCAFHPWATTAFSIPPSPKMLKPSFALHSTSVSSTGSGKAGWDMAPSSFARIEGQTRRTWQFEDVSKEVVQVAMKSEGRPMNADIELWIGPDWTPVTLKAYSEDGALRPVQTLIGTRNKGANVEVRNTAAHEFPLQAACSYAVPPLSDVRNKIPEKSEARYVEGGAVYSLPFEPDANQVQVLLNTDTRQLNAKVELLNGPNNIKQAFEVFTNNGLLNALYVVFNTPGGGNTVRVRNQAPLEFPLKAYISEA